MSQHEITLPSLQASYMWTDDDTYQASYMWTDGDDPQEQSYIKDKVTTVNIIRLMLFFCNFRRNFH